MPFIIRYWRGRTGNKMFQYATNRLFAEHFDTGFWSAPLEDFPIQRSFGETDPTRRVYLTKSIRDFSKIGKKTAQKINIMILPQYFPDFFVEHTARVRGMFRWNETESPNPGPSDILVSVRVGDFAYLGGIVDFSFYERVLEKLSFKRMYIVSNGLSHSYIDNFKKYKPILCDIRPSLGLQFARKFSTFVSSNSTYAWWQALLWDMDVHFPIINKIRFGAPAFSVMHRFKFVIDEKRFTYYYNVPSWGIRGKNKSLIQKSQINHSLHKKSKVEFIERNE